MIEQIEACSNDICIKKDQCERHRLFKDGQTFVRRFNGKPHKGCGQFIEISDDKKEVI